MPEGRSDDLRRQGQRLYTLETGQPWTPQAYTLTAPDGTRYELDAGGHVTQIVFADGAQWRVSDAGIAAVSSDANERVDFLRDSAGRIVRVSGPASAQPERTAIAYQYDAAGRLILARALDGGSPVGHPPYAYAIRASELASTVHAPGAQGTVIVAIETWGDASLELTGATLLGTLHIDMSRSGALNVGLGSLAELTFRVDPTGGAIRVNLPASKRAKPNLEALRIQPKVAARLGART